MLMPKFLQGLASLTRARPNMKVNVDNLVPRRNEPPMFDRFAEILPWVGYEADRRLFILEGEAKDSKVKEYEGLAFAIEISPQIGASPALATALADFGTIGAPAGTGLTVSLFGSPDIDPFLYQWIASTVHPDECRTEEKANQARVLYGMAQEYTQYMKKATLDPMADGLNMRVRNFRCVLSVVIPTKEPMLEASQKLAGSIRSQIIQKLKAFYMFQREWDATDLLQWTDMLLNPQHMFKHDRPEIQYDDGKEVRHQVVRPATMIEIEDNQINFSNADGSDKIVCRSYGNRSYPRQASLHSMKGLLGSPRSNAVNYPCPFVFTAGIQLLDFDSERTKTTARGLRAQQTAESQLGKMLPGAQEINEDYKIALRAFDTSKGTCRMFHELLLYARPDEIDAAEQCAIAVFRDQKWDIAPDALHHSLGLVASLPMTFGPMLQSDMKRMWKLSTKTGFNVGNILPVIAEWTGTPLPERQRTHCPQFMLTSRTGQPMLIDIFANPSGNYNGAIVGKSGSGKSFAANQLVLRHLALGHRAWVIDVGGSYKKLCGLLGGQYIEFTPDSGLSLNPFSLVGDDLNEDMEMLIPVIEMMASPSQKLPQYLRAQLEGHIKDIWATIEMYDVDPREVMTVTMLSESLKMNCALGNGSEAFQYRLNVMIRGALERKGYMLPPMPPYQGPDDETTINSRCDPTVREMGVSLSIFGEEGSYGKYFDKPANVNFNKDFVVLELEQLNQKPVLRSVVMMLLMQSITKSMYLSKMTENKQKMLCLIDEAWDLLSSEGAGPFIEAGYRRARKYGGAFWTATQSVEDYYKSDTALAALQNADWMFLLMQKKESVLQLETSKKLYMDDHVKEQLMGLTTQQGVYSEIFVRGGDLPAVVGRLFADPFTALVSSSRADDVGAVQTHVTAGVPIDQAIRRVLMAREAANSSNDDTRRAA